MSAAPDRPTSGRTGRPRDIGAEERILRATFEALATGGYLAMNMDDIARAAKVAKTTIYRRWKSKEALVTRCMQVYALRVTPAPTGDWRKDVCRALESMIEVVETPQGRAFMSVLAARYNNPDLEVAFDREYEEGGSPAAIRDALREGVRREELRADLDVDLTIELLLSVVFMRVVALREEVEPSLARQIVDAVLDGAAR